MISDQDIRSTILYLPDNDADSPQIAPKDDTKQSTIYHSFMVVVPDTPLHDNKDWESEVTKSADNIKTTIRKLGPATPVVVFIHGFSNTAKDVKKRANFIDEHIGTAGVLTVTYDWKTAESVLKYKNDQKKAIHHSERLLKYFQIVLRVTEATKLYIICHSMGNYILYNFLLNHVQKQNDFTFNKLDDCEVLALAADCDQAGYQQLVNDIMNDDNVGKYGIRKWTHYYNKKDEALGFSKSVENRSWKHIAGKNAIDNEYKTVSSIDCGKYRDKKFSWWRFWDYTAWYSVGHSYIDRTEIIDDIKKLMDGKNFSQRNLELIDSVKQIYKMK